MSFFLQASNVTLCFGQMRTPTGQIVVVVASVVAVAAVVVVASVVPAHTICATASDRADTSRRGQHIPKRYGFDTVFRLKCDRRQSLPESVESGKRQVFRF